MNKDCVIDYKYLISILNDGYDYLGMVTTPWHALSMVAAIKKLEDQTGKMKGIILVNRNPGESYLVDKTFFFNINADVFFFNGGRTKRQLFLFEIIVIRYALFISRNKSSVKKKFFVLAHNHPSLIALSLSQKYIKEGCTIVSVLCDEGVGSYTDDANDRLEQFKNDGSSKLKIIKNWFEEKFLYEITTRHLRSNNSYLDYCMLIDDGDIKGNSNIPEFITRELQEYAESVDFPYPKIENDYVLLNTQYFTKGEIDDVQKLLAFWKKVVDFYKRRNLEVWVKPHPRETNIDIYSSIGATVIKESSVAQEILLVKMKKPKYLISIYSTTLITAPILNGVPSICLANLTLNDSAYTDSYKRYTRKFIDKFRGITMVVDSIEDMPE